ncbi:integrin alpha, partial [Patescibacteria group bacterium]
SGWVMNTDLSTADASFWGEDADDTSGISVSGAGDVNGDGYDDFIIGAYWEDDGGSEAGQTYLILGKASGWAMDTDLSAVDASFHGEDAGDRSGRSVSGAGDVNGDGYDDFIIGAYYEDDGGSAAGQTYLILGKASGWAMDTDLSAADASFWGEDIDDYSGNSVSGAGDVNGDGYDDFIIGAFEDDDGGATSGQTYLVLGRASGWIMDTDLSAVDASFWGEDGSDRSGFSISEGGDANGDGYDDLLIGAVHDSDAGSRAGQAYLILSDEVEYSSILSRHVEAAESLEVGDIFIRDKTISVNSPLYIDANWTNIYGGLNVSGDINPISAPEIVTESSNTMSNIDSTGAVGYYTSIAIGADGLPIIAHYDGDLRACKCHDEYCTSATCTAIDTTNDVGGYTSVAIGTDDLPIISHLDFTNGDLRVCKCDDTSCTSATCTAIDSANVVGQYTSIAIGTDGLAVVSHYDTTNTALRVCKCSNNSCTSATCTAIDSANIVGQNCSLAIGTDGLPIISHRDSSTADLRACKCDNTTCTSATCNTIDATDNMGSYTSIAIGTDSLPVISYKDDTNLNLKVCQCDDTTCSSATCNTIDSSADEIGDYNSIAIGTDGLPIISHGDDTNDDLRVCKCTDAACSAADCTAVDSADIVGDYSSIAIGTDGRPVIAEFDDTNDDLKVIKCASESCQYTTTGAYYSGGSNLGSINKYYNNVYAVNYWAKEGMQISNFDLSEDYSAVDLSITAGDVVAPTGGSSISIDKTYASYQNDVIGVVSTEPGITLSDWSLSDEEKEAMRPVALAGRVPVKVSTENGSISKGDFLVPSTRPGYAMKACGEKYCQSGTTIGKALEEFNPDQKGDSVQVENEFEEAEEKIEELIEDINEEPGTEYLNDEIEEVQELINDLTEPIDSNYGEGRIMMFVNLSWYNPSPTTFNWMEDGEMSASDFKTFSNSDLLLDKNNFNSYIGSIELDSLSTANLNVTELLTSQQIRVGIFEAFEGENIILRLSESIGSTAFLIKDNTEETILGVDSTGKLTIKEDKENPSIGSNSIKIGETSVKVYTNKVTEGSRIFITPTVRTDKQLSVVEKAALDYFLVEISSNDDKEITFDWWLVN